MLIVRYIIRFILALIFIYAGIEKLFFIYDPSVFKSDVEMTDPKFFEFYDFLMGTGYLYFVGFFQLLNGILLVFKKTYLLGAVMMVPLILCLLMTHIFISRYVGFVLFDVIMLLLNSVLIMSHYKELRHTFLKTQTTII